MKVGELFKFPLRRTRIGFYTYGKAEPKIGGDYRAAKQRGAHILTPAHSQRWSLLALHDCLSCTETLDFYKKKGLTSPSISSTRGSLHFQR